MAWIPGYWGWEDETNEFIWISGIWRNVPPSRQWVPGYWAQAGEQWQWTSGYWAGQAEQEITYLPQPPKSLENGPSVEAPSSDNIWISGNWRYREDRYAWQPGYWVPPQQNWIYQPSHYQWTRRGYVYVDGYWDYNLARRGVLFAPVRFPREVYARPGYRYTPSMVIAVGAFLNHLFVRPSYGHYYFGDYYDPGYQTAGYVSLFNYHTDRHGHDPIYAQRRWEHRNEQGWEQARRDDYDYYRNNAAGHPARTWAAMSVQAVGSRRGQRDSSDFAVPFNTYVRNPGGRQAFAEIGKRQQTKLVEQREAMRKFGQDRQQLEGLSGGRTAIGTDQPSQVVREKFGRSPIVAKPAGDLSTRDTPPKLREPRIAPPVVAPEKPRDGKEPSRKEPLPIPGRGPNGSPGIDPRGKDAPRPDGKPEVTPPERPRPQVPEKVTPPERPRPQVPEKVKPPERPRPQVPEKVTPPERPRPQVPEKVTPPERPRPQVPEKVTPPERPRPQVPEKVTPPERPRPQMPEKITPPERPRPQPPERVAPPVRQPEVPRLPQGRPQQPPQKGKQTEGAKDGKREKP